MPCVTHLYYNDLVHFRRSLTNRELAELLLELNSDGERWAIQEIRCWRRLALFRRRPATVYSLFWLVDYPGSVEWQIINFPGGASSVNLVVGAAHFCH